MNSKYRNGEEVYAKTNLSQRLIISHYFRRVYYCTIKKEPNLELAYYEKELTSVSAVI